MGTVKLKLTDSTNDVVGALYLLFIQTVERGIVERGVATRWNLKLLVKNIINFHRIISL